MRSACHHTMKSASARMPPSSYTPRTTTPVSSSEANSSSTSLATTSRFSPSGAVTEKTDHMAYRIESLISRMRDGEGLLLMQPLSPLLGPLTQVGQDRVGRRATARHARGDAHPVVCRAGQLQPREGLDARPDPGDPVHVPDGVLRQGTAPPLDVCVDEPRQRVPQRLADL